MTLVSIFRERQNALLSKIVTEMTPLELQQIADEVLDEVCKAYIEQITPEYARILQFLIGTARGTLRIIKVVSIEQPAVDGSGPNQSPPQRNLLGKIKQGVNKLNWNEPPPGLSCDQQLLMVDREGLAQALTHVFALVDNALDDLSGKSVTVTANSALPVDDISVLHTLQYVLGVLGKHNDPVLSESTHKLTTMMQRQWGVVAKTLAPDGAIDLAMWETFDFESGAAEMAPGTYETELPALIKNNQVVLQGVVRQQQPNDID